MQKQQPGTENARRWWCKLSSHIFLTVLKDLAEICDSFKYCVEAKGTFEPSLSQGRIWQYIDLWMGNFQNLERTVVIAVVGFFSLILAIILLCFCLFTVYNCFYKRMAQKYFKRMEPETQITDVENDASLQEYDEILNGRHETTRITRLWVSWTLPFISSLSALKVYRVYRC